MSREDLKSGLERDPRRPGALPSDSQNQQNHHQRYHERVSTGHQSYGSDVATVEGGAGDFHHYHADERSELSSDVGTDVEGHPQEAYYQRSSTNTRSRSAANTSSRGNSNSTSRRASTAHSRYATNSSSESPATDYSTSNRSNSNTNTNSFNTAATTPTSASESNPESPYSQVDDNGDIDNVNVVGQNHDNDYTDAGLVDRANRLMDELARDTENYRMETKNIKKSLARMR